MWNELAKFICDFMSDFYSSLQMDTFLVLWWKEIGSL